MPRLKYRASFGYWQFVHEFIIFHLSGNIFVNSFSEGDNGTSQLIEFLVECADYISIECIVIWNFCSINICSFPKFGYIYLNFVQLREASSAIF